MALATSALKTAIENALLAAHGEPLTDEDSTFADSLSSAIEAFVKTGTVATTTVGATAQACTAGGAVGTSAGTGTGTIS